MHSLDEIISSHTSVTKEQLRKIRKGELARGKPYIEIIKESDLIDEEALLKILSEELNIPFADLDDISEPSLPGLNKKLSLAFMRENRIVPVALEDGRLTIVTSSPLDYHFFEELEQLTGFHLEIKIGMDSQIMVAIERFFGVGSHSMDVIISDMNGEDLEISDTNTDEVEHLKDLASEAPVIKLVNLLITRGIEMSASDIHIEPFEKQLLTRYRVDGILHEGESPPVKLQAALISRLKIMAKLDIAERRLPQDGRIKFNAVGKEIDMRVSTVPTVYGESVVLRILDRSSGHHSLHNIGFPEHAISAFEHLIARPYGMLLVTGPTGSGKTTTLYGAMGSINRPGVKIVTIEDPVEYQMKGVNQIQVNPQIGLNFANGLRSIVRQDPDVIMVGEIRDSETAEVAIQSSLTGHMVFSTVHTNDAAGAIVRLQDMGIEPFLLSSAVIGVLGQRLVRVICEHCRVPEQISPETFAKLGVSGAEIPDHIWKGDGCPKCNNTGYKGRSGIFELLVVGEEIKSLINKRTSSGIIKSLAREMGMKTLREDGWDKVVKGITSTEEVMRVTVEEYN